MRKLLFIAILLASTGMSCRKFVEQKQLDILIEAITTGSWVVEKFIDSGEDKTALFASYQFFFDKNETVTARSGVTNTAGTWSGDIQLYQITSNFPTAGEPLKRLNGTWTITNSTMTFVEARTGSGQTEKLLNLRQKP